MIDLLEYPGEQPVAGAVPLNIGASCTRTDDDALAVEFRLSADDGRIAVPAARKAAFADGLWKHTCFEVFISPGGGPAYHEYNLSPSGEWGLFSFCDYRDGQANADPALAPRIRFEQAQETMTLGAGLPLGRLLGESAGRPLRIGLSAVVEQSDGTLRYWALRHPAPRPDFHHAESFALCVEAKSEA
jgi:hypothetical protein